MNEIEKRNKSEIKAILMEIQRRLLFQCYDNKNAQKQRHVNELRTTSADRNKENTKSNEYRSEKR